MHLKSRTTFPPGGFSLLIPEIGMQKSMSGSFNEMVDAFSRIVQKNPVLAEKHGWPTNREGQESWIDERESRRLVASGYFGFVELDGDPPVPQGGVRRGGLAGVVAAADTALTGLAIYHELFTTSKPVGKEEAERRATICTDCRQNKPGGFKEWFVARVARGLTELVGIMRDLDLTTSRDNELGTCAACHCPMRAKVWVDLNVIRKHMPDADREKLDQRCWIL